MLLIRYSSTGVKCWSDGRQQFLRRYSYNNPNFDVVAKCVTSRWAQHLPFTYLFRWEIILLSNDTKSRKGTRTSCWVETWSHAHCLVCPALRSSTMALAALPYHEPGIVTILIQASFLIVLNGINWVLDNAIYCGLVGQILIGVAWGTPGANWLSQEVQDTVMQLGYLGLILIVYEGM